MNYYQAIGALFAELKDDDICLFTTGFISRSAFAVRDRKANIYLIGSMGLASSLALGIALNTKKRVFIFDGDGSALMDLGTMALIAAAQPSNLIHIVLDNKSYQSTGGQPTISKHVDLARVAESCGYKRALRFKTLAGNQRRLASALHSKGPALILFEIDAAASYSFGRVSLTPPQLRDRLMTALKKREVR